VQALISNHAQEKLGDQGIFQTGHFGSKLHG